MAEPDYSQVAHNVVLFGTSGAGKSSLINMLVGSDRAQIGHGAMGCTTTNTAYCVSIDNIPFTIYDTAGLAESNSGRIPNAQAIAQVYRLMSQLKDGVSLLLLVMRGPRIKKSDVAAWKLFRNVFGHREVNAAIVVTGMDSLPNADQWWHENKKIFIRQFNSEGEKGTPFAGAACITALPARNNCAQLYYNNSRIRVQGVIKECCMRQPWKMEETEWFQEAIMEAAMQMTWCVGFRNEVKEAIASEVKRAVQRMIDENLVSEVEAKKIYSRLKNIK